MSEDLTLPKLRTPRAAAIAGILFSLLLCASIALLGFTSPDETETRIVNPVWVMGLNLVPFAGIAFLWFIGVIRDHIGEYEDRFFATVFLGSGLLFLAMLFAAAAVAGGITANTGSLPATQITFAKRITYSIMNVYAMRMAAVFMLSTSTILLRTAILPRWLTYMGYAFAIIQLITLTFWQWIMLLFPLWILLLSIEILIRNLHASRVQG